MLLTFTEISACAVGLKSGVNTTSFFFKGLCHCLGKKWIFILLGLLGLEFKLIPLQFFFNLPTSYLWLDKPRLPVANVWQSLTQVTCSIDLSIDNSGQQGGGWQLGSGWHHHNHWWGQHRRNDASGGAEQDRSEVFFFFYKNHFKNKLWHHSVASNMITWRTIFSVRLANRLAHLTEIWLHDAYRGVPVSFEPHTPAMQLLLTCPASASSLPEFPVSKDRLGNCTAPVGPEKTLQLVIQHLVHF